MLLSRTGWFPCTTTTHVLLWLHCGCIIIVVHVLSVLSCTLYESWSTFLIEPPLSSLILVCIWVALGCCISLPMLCSSWEPSIYRLLVHLVQSMIWACTRGSIRCQNSADESGQLSNGSSPIYSPPVLSLFWVRNSAVLVWLLLSCDQVLGWHPFIVSPKSITGIPRLWIEPSCLIGCGNSRPSTAWVGWKMIHRLSV